jgi:hypothetical protein
MNEIIWKPVPREPYSRFYEVSNTGLVRRIPGFIADGRRIKGGELAKVLVKKYHLVLLQCEGKKWMPRVHQLVALAFIGEPPGAIGVTGWTVNHKNFEQLDNRVENLEWMTAQENHQNAVDNGRKAHGERHYKAILTADIVRKMRHMRKSGMKIKAIAESFGFKEHAASDVLLGRCWNHVT